MKSILNPRFSVNLNTIRPEGFRGINHDLYDICGRQGVLIMKG